MAKEGKRNVTTWLDDDQMQKLTYIIERMGGNPSNSYVLGKLIEQEYERLSKPNISDTEAASNLDDIYKVMALISQGMTFSDAESIKQFLKGGK